MDQQISGRHLWTVAVVCCTACLSLGLVYYAAGPSVFSRHFAEKGPDAYRVLEGYAWWAGWIVVAYIILPTIAILCLPGERLRDYHLHPPSFRTYAWWWLSFFVAALLVVGFVSQTPAFLIFYPMYPLAGRSWFDLLVWEAIYAAQFVAVEFFFRGFLLHGLASRFGAASIFVAVVPYAMVHFGKPWPEALGSIGAGCVLGWFALETQSIWGGVSVHLAAAWMMDLLALLHKGQVPWRHVGGP